MRFFFIIAIFLSGLSTSSQAVATRPLTEDKMERSVADSSEIDDFFCDFGSEPIVDIEEWKTYLSENLILDSISQDTIPAGTYTVMVQFSITAKGKLDNISVLKNPGHGLDQRVVKVISNCQGIWKVPNYRRIVNQRQSITFIVEDEKCEDNLPVELML